MAAVRAGFTLARRHKDSGKVEPRKRGRPNPEFEAGYVDSEGEFHAGDIPKGRRGRRSKRPGRPKGLKNSETQGIRNRNGLSEIDRIVRQEVDARLRAAKNAAIKAFEKALRA
jgi:hypothetical protein